MPALDRCEPQVVRALEKQSWRVTDRPYSIRVDEGRGGFIYADLRLEHTHRKESIIVVEIKCFAETYSLLDQFYGATGQYAGYRSALTLTNVHAPVYLAVPSTIYPTFFQKPLVQAILKDIGVKLIIVDLKLEEVVLWLP